MRIWTPARVVIYITSAATLEAHGHIVKETLVNVFDRMDANDTVSISLQNLQDFLATDLTKDKVQRMIPEVDLDCDGKITLDDFLTSFCSNHRELHHDLVGHDKSTNRNHDYTSN